MKLIESIIIFYHKLTQDVGKVINQIQRSYNYLKKHI